MSKEVFPYPTIKEVDFEIRFPHLFSIEKKIGDFQEKIITKFPESQRIFSRPILITDSGSEGKHVDVSEQREPNIGQTIWVFKSKQKQEVRVTTSSLAIVSTQYEAYNNPSSEKKFRAVIEYIVSNFFNIIKIPIIKRIGLRYVNEWPLPSKDNETLGRLYDSTFPIGRFPLKNAKRIYFEITTKRKNHNLIFREGLAKKKDQYKLLLDLDSFEKEIPSKDFLKVTDELHEIIEEEYFSIIKEPMKKYLRTGRLE